VIKGMSEQTYKLRLAVLEDPYAFAYTVCGFKDLSFIHKQMAETLKLFRDRKRLRIMELWPRGHFKTSMFSIAGSLWLLVNDPEERIYLCHQSGTVSEGWIRQMQQIILGKVFGLLFPELVPDPQKVDWTKEKLTINRKGKYDVPSVRAGGLDKQVTGEHFTRIILDDIVTEKNLLSPTYRKKTRQFFNRLSPLLTNQEKDGILIVGTRWHVADLYGRIIEKMQGDGKFDYMVRVKSAIENGVPIFPERYSKERLEAMSREMGGLFWAVMMNQPVNPADNPFNYDLLKKAFYEDLPDGKYMKVMVVDPAGPGSRDTKRYGEQSETAIVVCYISIEDDLPHIWVVDTISGNWDANRTADIIIDAYKKHKPDFFIIEANSGWIMMKPIIQNRADQRGVNISITEKKAVGTKEARAYPLKAYVDDNRLHLNPNRHEDLLSQIIAYPHPSKWDLLDALAYVPQIIDENPLYFGNILTGKELPDISFTPLDPDAGY